MIGLLLMLLREIERLFLGEIVHAGNVFRLFEADSRIAPNRMPLIRENSKYTPSNFTNFQNIITQQFFIFPDDDDDDDES